MFVYANKKKKNLISAAFKVCKQILDCFENYFYLN